MCCTRVLYAFMQMCALVGVCVYVRSICDCMCMYLHTCGGSQNRVGSHLPPCLIIRSHGIYNGTCWATMLIFGLFGAS